MENILYIYPTTRSIRRKKEEYLQSNSLVPKMITVSEFEKRAVVVEKRFISNIERVLYLKKASSFKEFNKLNIDKSLIKFYSHSKDFFRFFEELAYERVKINELFIADTYAEFDRDLNILDNLLRNYKELLKNEGLTDKISIPDEYRLNLDFIDSFDKFILVMEGVLTKFELELFLKISKLKPFEIKIRTNRFNEKMRKILSKEGFKLPKSSFIQFDLNSKRIIKSRKVVESLNRSELIRANSRLEQIAIALGKIEEYVKKGIEPEKIALILPDESIAKIIKRFDRKRNLNFAMGTAYRFHSSFIALEEILNYLSGDELSKEYLQNRGVNLELIQSQKGDRLKVDEFFIRLGDLNIHPYSSNNLFEELNRVNLIDAYFSFIKLLSDMELTFRNWLFLWINEIKDISIDDIDGGKVKVLGILESRAIEFDAVVIIDFIDSLIPAVSNKDRFLNSAVRANANLPTKSDREELQKYYYFRALESSKNSSIIYYESDEVMVSKFIYELGLEEKKVNYKAPIELLYEDKTDIDYRYFKQDAIEFNPFEMVWSHSSLKSFLECKRKFYYQYILKFEEPRERENSITDGLYLHNILKDILFSGKKFSSSDEIKREYFKVVAKIENSSAEFEFKKEIWAKLLNRFFEEQFEHLKEWEIVESEKSIEGVINGLRFKGRVDRVDRKGNKHLIIDYKSGSSRSANSKKVEKLKEFQMSIYSQLMDYQNMDFAFIEILNSGKIINLTCKSDKDKRLFEIIEDIKGISEFSPDMREDFKECKSCGFQLLCKRGDYFNG